MSKRQTRVTIVGGGVAATGGADRAARAREERVQIELVNPAPEWSYRPWRSLSHSAWAR